MIETKASEYDTNVRCLVLWIVWFYRRVRVGWELWWARYSANLTLRQASGRTGIYWKTLMKYEFGIESPRLCNISKLLEIYGASERVVFFFCTFPFRPPNRI